MKESLDIQLVPSPEYNEAMRERVLYLLGRGPVPKGLEQRAAEVRREMRAERRARRWAAIRKLFGFD